MQKIKYLEFKPEDEHHHTAQVIEAYRDIFATSPWHEHLKCECCEKYWGKKDLGLLAENAYQCCGKPLVDFWPRHEVRQNILNELSRENSAFIAVQDSSVIGFAWGYLTQASALADKLKIQFDAPVLEKLSNLSIAYQSDVAVLPEYRERKIAKQLVKQRLIGFQSKGVDYGVVRVRKSPEPSKTFLWYKKLGYEIIAEYPENDGRVIMGRIFNDELLQLLF